VPASLAGRGVLAAASRRRGLHHTEAASLPRDFGTLWDSWFENQRRRAITAVSPTGQDREVRTLPARKADVLKRAGGLSGGREARRPPAGACRPRWGRCPAGSPTGGTADGRRYGCRVGASRTT
jgi:hypothetical protein